MPSTIFAGAVSGGQLLCSGNPFSGQLTLPHEINLKMSNSGIGFIYVSLPSVLTTSFATFTSGGSLTSGGLADAWELSKNQEMTIPRQRLTSGIESIRLLGLEAASGTRIFWDYN